MTPVTRTSPCENTNRDSLRALDSSSHPIKGDFQNALTKPAARPTAWAEGCSSKTLNSSSNSLETSVSPGGRSKGSLSSTEWTPSRLPRHRSFQPPPSHPKAHPWRPQNTPVLRSLSAADQIPYRCHPADGCLEYAPSSSGADTPRRVSSPRN